MDQPEWARSIGAGQQFSGAESSRALREAGVDRVLPVIAAPVFGELASLARKKKPSRSEGFRAEATFARPLGQRMLVSGCG